ARARADELIIALHADQVSDRVRATEIIAESIRPRRPGGRTPSATTPPPPPLGWPAASRPPPSPAPSASRPPPSPAPPASRPPLRRTQRWIPVRSIETYPRLRSALGGGPSALGGGRSALGGGPSAQ